MLNKEPVLKIMPMPSDTNPSNHIFGGWIMSQIDIAGAVATRGISDGRVVTIAVDNMVLKKPIFVGDLVSFYADVVEIGNTSIKVEVKVIAERYPKYKQKEVIKEEVATAVIVYVNVDENGQKVKINKN